MGRRIILCEYLYKMYLLEVRKQTRHKDTKGQQRVWKDRNVLDQQGLYHYNNFVFKDSHI